MRLLKLRKRLIKLVIKVYAHNATKQRKQLINIKRSSKTWEECGKLKLKYIEIN